MPLANVKHEAVLQAYIRDPERIGWRAYKAAFPKSSQRAAQVAWSRLLKKADFKARIAELNAAAADAAVMDLREVLSELSKLGRANMQDFLVGGDDTAEVLEALRELSPEHAAAIQELTIETYLEGRGDDAREVKRVKLKLHSKVQALTQLLGHLAPQRHEITGKDGKPIEVKDVTEFSPLEIARRIAFVLEQGSRAPPAPQKKD